MRYFATRSFNEPVGLNISSFAQRATSGFGHIPGMATRGVFPIVSSIEARRPTARGAAGTGAAFELPVSSVT